MKADHLFRDYLTKEYRSKKTNAPFSYKVACDILSRCRRIETVFNMELSARFVSNDRNYRSLKGRIKERALDFGATSKRPYAYLQYIHALNTFRIFSGATPTRTVYQHEKPTASRSAVMRAVRASDTAPELAVRLALRAIGERGYRLHPKLLPGRPDIIFLRRRVAIFVHGCFWHSHNCPHGLRRPHTNLDYWLPKLERNQQRDASNVTALKAMNWKVFVVWECETTDPEQLKARLLMFLRGTTREASTAH